jgi:hypothetical protein
MPAPTPRMRIALTRGEVERLHEEIGDIKQQHVGPKLRELYQRLDNVLGVPWDEKTLREQQWRGVIR